MHMVLPLIGLMCISHKPLKLNDKPNSYTVWKSATTLIRVILKTTKSATTH